MEHVAAGRRLRDTPPYSTKFTLNKSDVNLHRAENLSNHVFGAGYINSGECRYGFSILVKGELFSSNAMEQHGFKMGVETEIPVKNGSFKLHPAIKHDNSNTNNSKQNNIEIRIFGIGGYQIPEKFHQITAETFDQSINELYNDFSKQAKNFSGAFQFESNNIVKYSSNFFPVNLLMMADEISTEVRNAITLKENKIDNYNLKLKQIKEDIENKKVNDSLDKEIESLTKIIGGLIKDDVILSDKYYRMRLLTGDNNEVYLSTYNSILSYSFFDDSFKLKKSQEKHHHNKFYLVHGQDKYLAFDFQNIGVFQISSPDKATLFELKKHPNIHAYYLMADKYFFSKPEIIPTDIKYIKVNFDSSVQKTNFDHFAQFSIDSENSLLFFMNKLDKLFGLASDTLKKREDFKNLKNIQPPDTFDKKLSTADIENAILFIDEIFPSFNKNKECKNKIISYFNSNVIDINTINFNQISDTHKIFIKALDTVIKKRTLEHFYQQIDNINNYKDLASLKKEIKKSEFKLKEMETKEIHFEDIIFYKGKISYGWFKSRETLTLPYTRHGTYSRTEYYDSRFGNFESTHVKHDYKDLKNGDVIGKVFGLQCDHDMYKDECNVLRNRILELIQRYNEKSTLCSQDNVRKEIEELNFSKDYFCEQYLKLKPMEEIFKEIKCQNPVFLTVISLTKFINLYKEFFEIPKEPDFCKNVNLLPSIANFNFKTEKMSLPKFRKIHDMPATSSATKLTTPFDYLFMYWNQLSTQTNKIWEMTSGYFINSNAKNENSQTTQHKESIVNKGTDEINIIKHVQKDKPHSKNSSNAASTVINLFSGFWNWLKTKTNESESSNVSVPSDNILLENSSNKNKFVEPMPQFQYQSEILNAPPQLRITNIHLRITNIHRSTPERKPEVFKANHFPPLDGQLMLACVLLPKLQEDCIFEDSTDDEQTLIAANDFNTTKKIKRLTQLLANARKGIRKLRMNLPAQETKWAIMGLELHNDELKKLKSELGSGKLTQETLTETIKDILYFCKEVNKSVLELATPNNELASWNNNVTVKFNGKGFFSKRNGVPLLMPQPSETEKIKQIGFFKEGNTSQSATQDIKTDHTVLTNSSVPLRN